MSYTFKKESILPATDPKSPFYLNVPPPDATPVDDLVQYFKCWKKFIKSLIYYLKEVALVKAFTSKINLQLINSVIFPGQMNLPLKYMAEVSSSMPNENGAAKKSQLQNLKQQNHSSSDLSNASRPHLFKSKSNSSFLKPSQTAKSLEHTMNPSNIISATSNLIPGHHKSNSINNGNSLAHSAEKSESSGSNNSSNPQSMHIVSKPKVFHNDINIPKNFFNNETSLFPNLPQLLANNHFQAFQGELKTNKEITSKMIARLESLLRNLSAKIREIKTSLKNDNFANTSIVKEISKTGQILNAYMKSVETYNAQNPVLKSNSSENENSVYDDPFLLKLQLNAQLKNQMVQENYCYAAYANLQNIARDLSNFVLKDLKSIAHKYGKLIDHETCYTDSAVSSLLSQLLQFTNKTKPEDEWDYFIANNPNFINTNPNLTGLNPYKNSRSLNHVVLPYADSIHNKCIRNGKIYKKSKILKNYNVYYYILTCNYLHEFKIPEDLKKDKSKIGGFIGGDEEPERSYNLNDFILKPKGDDKFIIQSISNKSNKYTFKCNNEADFQQWYADLSDLLKFGPHHLERFDLLHKKIGMNNKEQRPIMSRESSNVQQQSLTVDKSNKPMNLDLSGQNFNSLTGIYTPKIGTPIDSANTSADSSSYKEKNPFENTFSQDRTKNGSLSIRSGASTPNSVLSSPSIMQQGVGQISPDINGQQSPSNINFQNLNMADAINDNSQHENYLKLQQQYLDEQQRLLTKKIEESGKNRNEASQNLNPNTLTMHRDSSSTSLSSLGLPSSSIHNFLNNFSFPQNNATEIADASFAHISHHRQSSETAEQQSQYSQKDDQSQEKSNVVPNLPHFEHTEH